MYERIETYKAVLEEGFEEGLIWDFVVVRETGQEVCRIYTLLEGVDIHRKSDWPKMHFLQNNFLEIRDLIKDENW